jgi:Reverse transcriptase (RNA-dependent DNA polymerase)
LTTNPPRVVEAFCAHFFPASPNLSNSPLPNLPFPAHPTRPFLEVMREEVSSALHTCANKSSPGLSGIAYKIIHWVHEARPDLLPALFSEALQLRTHPWTEAKVVVIPKPGKADYSAPKAYRPISLLKCTRKVLEKVVATCLRSDIDHYSLIPPSQFGSRHYHSATNAATMLRYKAEMMIKAGRIGAVLLMDISRFFNSL